jgi:hypothetical protein
MSPPKELAQTKTTHWLQDDWKIVYPASYYQEEQLGVINCMM